MCLPLLSPEEQQETGDDQNDIGKKGSLDPEADIVGKAVSRGRRVQLKDRVGHDDSAVWKPEKDILGEIPCGVDGKGAPETVQIVYEQRTEGADRKNIDDRQDGHAFVCQMEQGKQQGVAKDRNCRMPVVLPQLLIEIPSAQQLLRGRLHEHCKKENKEGKRVKGIVGKRDVLVQPGNEYTDPIEHKSKEKTKQQQPAIVARTLDTEFLQDRPVLWKDK